MDEALTHIGLSILDQCTSDIRQFRCFEFAGWVLDSEPCTVPNPSGLDTLDTFALLHSFPGRWAIIKDVSVSAIEVRDMVNSLAEALLTRRLSNVPIGRYDVRVVEAPGSDFCPHLQIQARLY